MIDPSLTPHPRTVLTPTKECMAPLPALHANTVSYLSVQNEWQSVVCLSSVLSLLLERAFRQTQRTSVALRSRRSTARCDPATEPADSHATINSIKEYICIAAFPFPPSQLFARPFWLSFLQFTAFYNLHLHLKNTICSNYFNNKHYITKKINNHFSQLVELNYFLLYRRHDHY